MVVNSIEIAEHKTLRIRALNDYYKRKVYMRICWACKVIIKVSATEGCPRCGTQPKWR